MSFGPSRRLRRSALVAKLQVLLTDDIVKVAPPWDGISGMLVQRAKVTTNVSLLVDGHGQLLSED